MIPAHSYLSMIVPPADRMIFAGALVVFAVILSYLLVKGLLHYSAWKRKSATGEIRHER